MKEGSHIDYRLECIRKFLHLCSLIIPLSYWLLDKNEIFLFLAPVTMLVVTIDTLRHYHKKTGNFYNLFFGKILRGHEHNGNSKKWSGATPLFLSTIICIIIFPKIIAITSLTILAISDTAAALIGRKWGKHNLYGKSIEGTLAFIISGIIVVLLIKITAEENLTFLIFGITGVTMAAIAEVFSRKIGIDDNFAIPITVGIIMSSGSLLVAS